MIFINHQNPNGHEKLFDYCHIDINIFNTNAAFRPLTILLLSPNPTPSSFWPTNPYYPTFGSLLLGYPLGSYLPGIYPAVGLLAVGLLLVSPLPIDPPSMSPPPVEPVSQFSTSRTFFFWSFSFFSCTNFWFSDTRSSFAWHAIAA